MNALFSSKTTFDEDLSAWDVQSVTNMISMFNNAQAFNSDLSSWNVAKVTRMDFMFKQCYLFNGDISTWNTANVEGDGMKARCCSALDPRRRFAAPP